MRVHAAILIAAQSADVATTWHALTHGLANEGNPLALALLAHGWLGLAVPKAVATGVALLVVALVARRDVHLAQRLLAVPTLLMVLVVAWNVRQVLNG